ARGAGVVGETWERCDVADRAAFGRATVQRALRALQHLDALEVIEERCDDAVVLCDAAIGALADVRVVQVDAGRGGAGTTDDAADGKRLLCADLLCASSIGHGVEARYRADQILRIANALA